MKDYEARRRVERESLRDMLRLPTSYAGQPATVTAVVVPKGSARGNTSFNALGEPVAAVEIRNPLVSITVQFADGLKATLLGRCARIASLLSDTTPILPERLAELDAVPAHAAWAETAIASAISQGGSVYAVAGSCVFPLSASVEDVFSSSRVRRCAGYLDVPFLERLSISQGRYVVEADGLVLKLSAQNQKEYLIGVRVPGEPRPDLISAAAAAGNLLTQMPAGLKPFELEAIKAKLVLAKGLSRSALSYMWGQPETENNYGAAGRQLVYRRGFGATVYVYLDRTGVVTDWQEIRQ
jgi:hypothetical protein